MKVTSSPTMMCTNCGHRRAATRLGLTLCVVCAGIIPDPDAPAIPPYIQGDPNEPN